MAERFACILSPVVGMLPALVLMPVHMVVMPCVIRLVSVSQSHKFFTLFFTAGRKAQIVDGTGDAKDEGVRR